MYQENNCIEEQSFFLDFNVKDRHIRGHTKIKLKLEKPGLQENIPVSINLCAKQIDVKAIDMTEMIVQKEDQEAPTAVEDRSSVQVKWDYPSTSVQVSQNILYGPH